jgi:hypothetical protein
MARSEQVAMKVAAKYGSLTGNKEAAFDPSIILVFADLILEFAELFKSCNKTPLQAANAARNPNLWERFLLRRYVRQNMTRREFRDKGNEIVEALLSGGKDASEADFKELYDEV